MKIRLTVDNPVPAVTGTAGDVVEVEDGLAAHLIGADQAEALDEDEAEKD
jgi:hypothetical protein